MLSFAGPLKSAMQLDIFTLSNGIRVVHREINRPVAHLGLLIAAGSRDELEDEQGLAHFIEHCLFKGTQKRKAYHILSRMEDVGGELNAFTSKEETVIHSSFLSGDYARAVDLICDIAFRSTFPPKECEKEKEVIIDEINSYKDSPSDSIFDDFEELVFPNHSLGRNILGTLESVKGFGTEDIHKFLNRNYSADRMVFSSVGNISAARLRNLLEKQVEDIQFQAGEKRELIMPEPTQPIRDEQTRSGYQTHVVMGSPAYAARHDHMRPLALLNNILGGPGMNSRLNLNIRERYGFTYHLESFYHPYLDTGLFGIYLGTDPGTADRAMNLIDKELKKLRDQKLGVLQLSKAKKQILGQFAMAQENNGALMLSFGKSLLLHDEIESFEEIVQDVEAMKAETLLEVANDILVPEKFSRLIFRNTQP
ncbi:M16 family metallopeptidase [Croceimicrobium hydrocarbonivorans]|nr:pitrilysin family protein [Croceimicrobium hydrocarbonivorans]